MHSTFDLSKTGQYETHHTITCINCNHSQTSKKYSGINAQNNKLPLIPSTEARSPDMGVDRKISKIDYNFEQLLIIHQI